ncbi:quaternary ammonium compound-resistance protein SugE [Paenibacillus sp. UNC496MF]|uniref:DMT family transporter n=1 Tax=Paenibacillus sp. UNC496MF TaxID=1502753 RepID=UPI0008F0AEF0|nr:multidrug efflux SMR transporter [Paenibacillus sp. UNC496MF]SFJ24717.1 quaternary ammonium compound-resistance protein SugE [Paenibacillus sp. UNC496MF]
MAWLYLLIAGGLEVAWAYGLQESEGFTKWLPSVVTVVLLAASFFCFAKAMKRVEIGTAYAVFTGIGSVGTVIVSIAVLDEPVNVLKLLFIALLVGGIVGLKVVSGRTEAEEAASRPKAMTDAETAAD